MSAIEGVEVRHGTGCGTSNRRACTCRPNVRAQVSVNGKVIRRSFNGQGTGSTEDRINAARSWRLDAIKMISAGTFQVASGRSIRMLLEEFLSSAEKGHIKARGGARYAPSSLRRMRQAAEYRIVPKWGDLQPEALGSHAIERYVEQLNEEGLSASSVQNTIKPLSAMYRWACRTNRVNCNPTIGVLLPTGGRKRERIATPDEAAKLLDALTDEDRILWAIAFYGGLRRSEVLGLEWENVDMKARTIRVRKTYHQESRVVRPLGKSRAAHRTVPMPGPLAVEFARHEPLTDRRKGFVIGNDTPGVPHWTIFLTRAYKAWETSKLSKLCFHEARHTYASWIIAAAARSGEYVDWKELAGLMGHENVAMTIDLYGKLMPDHVDRAGRRLDKFLTDYGTDQQGAG